MEIPRFVNFTLLDALMYSPNEVSKRTTLIIIYVVVVWICIVLLLPGVAIFALLDPMLELPFPLSIHVVLALGVPVLATLGSWHIAGRSPSLDRYTLAVITLAVGIEILATLQALAMPSLLRGTDVQPPAPLFLFLAAHRHPVILLCAIFTLVLTIHDGRACLEHARAGHDRAALQTGLELYGHHRILFAGCLALASGDVWLAAAMPLACLAGLAIACRDHLALPAGVRAACYRLLRIGQARPPARENRP